MARKVLKRVVPRSESVIERALRALAVSRVIPQTAKGLSSYAFSVNQVGSNKLF